MKFLCMECDQPMKLQETQGPDEGSMTIVFACPECSRQIAMLTNAMETQMVRSLGVQIGPAHPEGHAEPMKMIRESLQTGEASPAESQPDAEAPGPSPDTGSASRCPFTGMVEEAFARQQASGGPVWTDAARNRLERIPAFVRPMVQKSIEQFAAENGYQTIDEQVVEEIRGKLGMGNYGN